MAIRYTKATGKMAIGITLKDKLTLLDGVSKVETLASSSSSSTPLSIDQLFNEHTESEQNAV